MSAEKYAVHQLAEGNRDNYRAAVRKAALKFQDQYAPDPQRPVVCEDEQQLTVRLFDLLYRVSKTDGMIRRLSGNGTDGEEADFNEAMTLYDLLCHPGALPSGSYTKIRNLSAVQTAASYAGQGLFEGTVRKLSGRTEQLRHALTALGGVNFGKGDVSYKVPVFGDLCLVFSFWEADDEFPASLNLLFDRNTLSFMHYETVWYLAGQLLSRITHIIN